MRSEQPLFYLISMKLLGFYLFIIQHTVNTLDIFDTLEYPWLFMVYIHNILFELHGIVSNEMAFNLLCEEILSSSAHI